MSHAECLHKFLCLVVSLLSQFWVELSAYVRLFFFFLNFQLQRKYGRGKYSKAN